LTPGSVPHDDRFCVFEPPKVWGKIP